MTDYTPIPSTPLQINLAFVRVDDQPPPAPHYIHSPGGALWQGVLLQNVGLDQPDPTLRQSEIQQVQNFLQNSLQQVFNSQWTTMQSQVGPSIVKAVQTAVPQAYNISITSLPPTGQLRATAGNVSPGLAHFLPSGIPGQQLTLSFWLPGFKVNFDKSNTGPLSSWADPNIDLTFDGEYLVEIVVPSKSSVPLGINTEFFARNIKASGTSIFSDAVLFEQYLQDLVKALWLGNSVPPTGSSWPDSSVPMSVPDAFATLSTAFTSAASKGFTELSVSIDTNPPDGNPPGNTVMLTLTHPFNQGPALIFGDTGPYTPTIFVNPTQVHPGDEFTVTGENFPVPRSTKAVLWWLPESEPHRDLAAQADVEFGVPFSTQVIPSTFNKAKLAVNAGSITVNNLTPNTRFSFRVRTYDVDGFIASDWGSWAVFTTRPTDASQVVLQNATSATATKASPVIADDGTLSVQLKMPADERPGVYTIAASIPGQPGSVTASVTVLAPGALLAPEITLFDVDGTEAQSGHIGISNSAPVYTIEGRNWRPGHVDLWLGSALSGVKLASAVADQNGAFVAKNIAFADALKQVGPRRIVAVEQGYGSAEFDVMFEGPPH